MNYFICVMNEILVDFRIYTVRNATLVLKSNFLIVWITIFEQNFFFRCFIFLLLVKSFSLLINAQIQNHNLARNTSRYKYLFPFFQIKCTILLSLKIFVHGMQKDRIVIPCHLSVFVYLFIYLFLACRCSLRTLLNGLTAVHIKVHVHCMSMLFVMAWVFSITQKKYWHICFDKVPEMLKI